MPGVPCCDGSVKRAVLVVAMDAYSASVAVYGRIHHFAPLDYLGLRFATA